MQAGLEALAGEGRQDVVTLVRRDPLLQSPHPGLGRDLSYDTRHLPHTDYLSVSVSQSWVYILHKNTYLSLQEILIFPW